jgi:hypothetical protein
LRQHCILSFDRKPEIDHAIDFMPIDAQRQGAPEPDIADQFPEYRILDRQIGQDRLMRAFGYAPQIGVIVMAGLVPLQ